MTTEEMTCREAVEQLERIREEHQARADSAAAQERVLRALLEGVGERDEAAGPDEDAVGREAESAPPDDDPAESAPAGRRTGPAQLDHTRVDFTGTANIRERVRRVAETFRGIPLSPTEVTRVLLDSGQHRSTMVNLRPAVYRTLRDNREDYHRVGNGCFELKPAE